MCKEEMRRADGAISKGLGQNACAVRERTVREHLSARQADLARSMSAIQNKIDSLPAHMLEMPVSEFRNKFDLDGTYPF